MFATGRSMTLSFGSRATASAGTISARMMVRRTSLCFIVLISVYRAMLCRNAHRAVLRCMMHTAGEFTARQDKIQPVFRLTFPQYDYWEEEIRPYASTSPVAPTYTRPCATVGIVNLSPFPALSRPLFC